MSSSHHISRFAARVGVVAWLALTLSGAARAATVLEVDVAEATRLSEWVVRARVTALTNVDLRAQGDSLYTDVTLAVDAVYAGRGAPATVVMRLQGGLGADGLALTVPGMPRFAIGDDAVIFLERTGKGLVPCGMGQGVWRVAPGPLGFPVVHRDVRELALVTRTPDGRLVPSTTPAATGIKLLTSLVAEIQAADRARR